MVVYERMTRSQAQAYLQRLELFTPLFQDLNSLNALLFAQLTHIPFDSLDVWGSGACPSLELTDLFDKIVVRDRGGYCFELNTLFRSLLNFLGFDAYQAIACILNPDGTPQPPAHNIIICRMDNKKYFLDVGYGGPVPYQALELREGKQGDFLFMFENDFWYVYRDTQTEKRPLTCFRDIPVTLNELIPLNYYISQRPDSHFRHLIHLSQRKADGSIYSLDGNVLKIHTATGVTIKEIADISDVKDIMRTYFNMDPDSAPLRDII